MHCIVQAKFELVCYGQSTMLFNWPQEKVAYISEGLFKGFSMYWNLFWCSVSGPSPLRIIRYCKLFWTMQGLNIELSPMDSVQSIWIACCSFVLPWRKHHNVVQSGFRFPLALYRSLLWQVSGQPWVSIYVFSWKVAKIWFGAHNYAWTCKL